MLILMLIYVSELCPCAVGLLRLGFEHPTYNLQINALVHCAIAAVIVN